jgi:DNA-binding GntR family transcriptional regulator
MPTPETTRRRTGDQRLAHPRRERGGSTVSVQARARGRLRRQHASDRAMWRKGWGVISPSTRRIARLAAVIGLVATLVFAVSGPATAAPATNASASVANLQVTLSEFSQLTADAVSSECSYDSTSGTLSGSSTIAGGSVQTLGSGINLEASPAPNTTVRSFDPSVATFVLNRQTTLADGSLVVDAIYIRLLNGQEVVIATSHCHPNVPTQSSASASVANLQVTLSEFSQLTADAVSSECSYDSTSGTLSGSSTIAGGSVQTLGSGINLEASPAPNTTVRSFDPSVATFVLNRQTTLADGSLVVDAIYIRLLNGQEVVIATSHCHPNVLSTTTTSTTTTSTTSTTVAPTTTTSTTSTTVAPTTTTKVEAPKQKCNAGRGNGSEGTPDCDPGRSGGRNQGGD